MKNLIRSIALFLLFHFSFPSYSQDITGIWRGYFITENGDQYKFELQLDQAGSRLSGVSYSYLTTVFYGKATLTGNYNRLSKRALITEIKTIEVRMSSFSSACIMKCNFEYAVSGKEQFLEGSFTSKFEKTGPGAKKGDDCGSGKVYLRKVQTSDFYVEPFLRTKLKADSLKIKKTEKSNTVSTTKPPVKKQVTKTKPVAKKPPVVNKKPALKSKPPVATKKPVTNGTTKPVAKIPEKKNTNTTTTIPEKQPGDSAKKAVEIPLTKETIPQPSLNIPSVLKNRENALVKTLVVNNPDITIKVYDNGIVDGDTISVYVDKKLMLHNKGLSETPITFKLKMDEDNNEHEVTMVAENLGKIPPNTSLMIVEAGSQRFNVFISSNEQKNAVVRFRYQKPN